MESNQNYNHEAATWLLKEMAEVKQHILELKNGPLLTSEWIPRYRVMEFFQYGDTQMGTLEKEEALVVSKIGNRKFYHRASLLHLLENNIL